MGIKASILLWVLTVVMFLAPMEAGAQSLESRCPPSLVDALDTDNNGSITMQEYIRFCGNKEAAKLNFRKLDQNSDEVLDHNDSWILFQKFDRNQDRRLDPDELQDRWRDQGAGANWSKAEQDMENLDFNSDGVITYNEFKRNWLGIPMVSW